MRYDQFIDYVQQRTGLDSREEVEELTEVVLSTLGERIYRTEREELAAQLPDELKVLIHKRAEPEMTREDTERYALEEFYNRVSQRADLSNYERTKELTQAVISVLSQAVSPGELRDLLESLPDEYESLFW